MVQWEVASAEQVDIQRPISAVWRTLHVETTIGGDAEIACPEQVRPIRSALIPALNDGSDAVQRDCQQQSFWLIFPFSLGPEASQIGIGKARYALSQQVIVGCLICPVEVNSSFQYQVLEAPAEFAEIIFRDQKIHIGLNECCRNISKRASDRCESAALLITMG
jgi:hypothetical protein